MAFLALEPNPDSGPRLRGLSRELRSEFCGPHAVRKREQLTRVTPAAFRLGLMASSHQSWPAETLVLCKGPAICTTCRPARLFFTQSLATNDSFGVERDVEQLNNNNLDLTKWSNPLGIQLPHTLSIRKTYCVSGHRTVIPITRTIRHDTQGS
ncbi:hypothetical protein C8Q76DRAFT_802449 [Earliella scabrosa]|nr:hypothetical protein C8Q76DRAFT_802449 [Earliella scabrosa]